jgi:hypothetical protein
MLGVDRGILQSPALGAVKLKEYGASRCDGQHTFHGLWAGGVK